MHLFFSLGDALPSDLRDRRRRGDPDHRHGQVPEERAELRARGNRRIPPQLRAAALLMDLASYSRFR